MRSRREVAASTKSHLRACGIGFAFRCCKIYKGIFYPFCSDAMKGVFIMSVFKKLFPKLKTRDISLLGLLIAITVLLAVYCTFRIGTIVKIPLKFISVFLTAALYGPFYGGMVAAIGDILNCLLAPVGPFVPQITVMEFVSGFAFGLFFYLSKAKYLTNVILCAVSQFFIAIVLNTAMYTFYLKWFPDFVTAFWTRLPASVIQLVLQLVLMLALAPLLKQLKLSKQKERKA